jgi:hypothetical protein
MMRQVAESEFREDSSHEDESSSHGEEPAEEPKLMEEREFSAKQAARSTNCVGYVVLCLLIFTGSILSILAHFYVKGTEQEDFEKGVRQTSTSYVFGADEGV